MKIGKNDLFHKSYRDRRGRKQFSKTWTMRFYRNGKEVDITSGTEDRAEAEQVYLRELANYAERGPETTNQAQVTVGQLLGLVLDEYKLKNRRTHYNKKREIESVLMPRVGHLKAMKFGTQQIKAYIEARQKDALWSTKATQDWKKKGKKVAPATINRELATIRRAFNLGSQHDPPLVSRVPKFMMLEEDNVREGVVTHDQYQALRSKLPPPERLALVISYHTGARLGELLLIEKPHVDLKAGRIKMPGRTTKSKKPKYIPIYGDMREEIEGALQMGDKGCSFLVQRDGAMVDDIGPAWERACKACGIPSAIFHDLRRTALTNMIEAGFSEKEAMEISGHKTAEVFRRYHIVSEKRMQRAGERLEAHMKKKEEEGREGMVVQ